MAFISTRISLRGTGINAGLPNGSARDFANGPGVP
jgi:hypothetical protein